MGEKHILGFEYQFMNTDDICPNCGKLTIPILTEREKGFLGLHIEYWMEYHCSKCGLKWEIKQ